MADTNSSACSHIPLAHADPNGSPVVRIGPALGLMKVVVWADLTGLIMYTRMAVLRRFRKIW